MDVFGYGRTSPFHRLFIPRIRWWLFAIGLFGVAARSAAGPLPPDPSDWVCPSSRVEPTQAQFNALCGGGDDKSDFGRPADLPAAPASLEDLDAKNRYDEALATFVNERRYKKYGWRSDQNWRLTGPYVGRPGHGNSYGTHPAVKIYYSPRVTRWLCNKRRGDIPDGAMIVKEMRKIDASLGIELDGEGCMEIPDSDLSAKSWAVMVKHDELSYDGWYWAAFAEDAEDDQGTYSGNPPIHNRSAITTRAERFFGPSPIRRNPLWYPTGALFKPLPQGQHKHNTVFPYNEFGNYCVNCHASAEKEFTYSSLENLLTPGLKYKGYNLGENRQHATDANNRTIDTPWLADKHARDAVAAPVDSDAYQNPFADPLPEADDDFLAFYDQLPAMSFEEALELRLPAETFDHRVAGEKGPAKFLTSDQCVGCHDGTFSNAATPNMVIKDEETQNLVNLSPYGEWRASPMGLAGRDPIFFAQLQSETNHLPERKECIENTCLHCHGVMGQRQQAIDTRNKAGSTCKDMFAVKPPEGVPFGEPFAMEQITRWQGQGAKYGALARDGISCTVCHRIEDTGFDKEASYTGNFVTGENDEIFGPFADDSIVTKPMERALGVTPKHGKQIRDSALCGSCHNILLPVFNNDGTPHEIKREGQVLTASYEQTTHLEWLNSDFAKPDGFKSCQDCHMGGQYEGRTLEQKNLAGETQPFRIANIESSEFPPTTHRLPDKQIELTPRPGYRRHQLHGLNVFLNEMFQQFPLILGVRQIDYMTGSGVTPPLITGRESMLEMADNETANIAIESFSRTGDKQLTAEVLVTNKVGHYLPSGVGFRRVFLEVLLLNENGRPLWASGRTNDLGAIVNGTGDRVLPSEQPVKNPKAPFQPHYQRINRGDQAQIYQELITDSAGQLTTSFLRRVNHVKDNRLRPKGFDPEKFLNSASPYIRILGEIDGRAAKDPYYSDPDLTGADRIRYQMTLPDNVGVDDVARLEVTLYSQSIPPFYLQQRFRDAKVGPESKSEIRRLFYMTGHLNTEVTDNSGDKYIADWKLAVTDACRTLQGPCN